MSPRISSELCGWENIQTHLQATPSTLSCWITFKSLQQTSAEGAQKDAEDRGARLALPVPLKSSLNTACVKRQLLWYLQSKSKQIHYENPVPKGTPLGMLFTAVGLNVLKPLQSTPDQIFNDTTLYFLFFNLAMPRSMWDLHYTTTRGQTRGPCIGSAESYPGECQGSPFIFLF